MVAVTGHVREPRRVRRTQKERSHNTHTVMTGRETNALRRRENKLLPRDEITRRYRGTRRARTFDAQTLHAFLSATHSGQRKLPRGRPRGRPTRSDRPIPELFRLGDILHQPSSRRCTFYTNLFCSFPFLPMKPNVLTGVPDRHLAPEIGDSNWGFGQDSGQGVSNSPANFWQHFAKRAFGKSRTRLARVGPIDGVPSHHHGRAHVRGVLRPIRARRTRARPGRLEAPERFVRGVLGARAPDVLGGTRGRRKRRARGGHRCGLHRDHGRQAQTRRGGGWGG